MSKQKCECCGVEYWPRQSNQRFCTPSCNHAWNGAAAQRGRELLRAEQGTTYAALAAGALGDECGGRFASPDRRPLSTVCDLPPDAVSGWAHDPVPPEPPLGIDVNEVGFAAEGQRHG
jgi:hypothetical protein